MAEKTEYVIYDLNHNIVTKGYKKQVCEFLNISEQSQLTVYATTGYVLRKKYRVGIAGEEEEREKSRIEDQIIQLSKYGNTTAMEGKLKRNIELLEAKGIKVKERKTNNGYVLERADD